MTTTVSSPVMVQARILVEALLQSEEPNAALANRRSDPFVGLRPNSLAESYRHGQGAAQALAEWQADTDLQAAGLLHSLVWKEALSPDQVAMACGQRVSFLCEEYRRIMQQQPEGPRRGLPRGLRRINLFTAAYREADLAFLGVASLYDHFMLARQGETRNRRSFVDEARQVMIPLLEMLGMWELKEEVEAWVMQQGQSRRDYDYLSKRLVQTEAARRQAFELISASLGPVLPKQADLARKMRGPVHIYNPHLPQKTHPEALQKLSVDVMVESEADCYEALRWIHHFWKPVEGSLSDYIGTSKINGYRCLRTAVILNQEAGHIRVHFHIRTHQMDEVNRWGLAALRLRERLPVDLPQAWWSRRTETYARIASAPPGSLPETLYVFSPQGEVFRFHRGCTVVDYAYAVHSEVAHRTKRFRVNGEVVGPTTILRHLDLVELEQDPQFPGPNRVWLTAARTGRARSHVERFLKRKGQGSAQGQKLFERELQKLKTYYRLDIPEHRVERALHQMARHLKLDRPEDVLAEIAAGRLTSEPLLHPLFSEEIIRQVQLPSGLRLFPHQLNLAQCCKPRPGDDIVGRPRLRRAEVVGLKIHQADCRHIVGNERMIPLTWRLRPPLKTAVRLEITGLHEIHLLDEILQLFYTGLPQLVIHKIEYVSRNGVARMACTIEAKDQALIDRIVEKLEHMPGRKINEVRQMQLLLSEREELARTRPASFNPYRRLPVRDREMFFGRSEELAKVYELLRSGVGAIFVQGQKRVGKTSLLLHLKEHYLDRNFAVPVYIDFQILGHLAGPAFFYYRIANAVYNELQADDRISYIGPPLWELFKSAPLNELTAYLRSVQSHFGSTRLVLLIDEFSRTIDAYRQQKLDHDFFREWLGLLQATMPQICYIMVVQQQTYHAMLDQSAEHSLDPIWQLLQIGETLAVKPLSEKDARQLIERPTYNYLEYSTEALQYVWRLTGGSPFLIQTFCFNLVRHMARGARRRVELADIEIVTEEFMHPNESIFAHLLDMVRGVGQKICRQLTQFLDETDQAVPLTELGAALPDVPAERLLSGLQELEGQHIITETGLDTWQFASLLFGRWLARNTVLEQFGPSGQGGE